MDFERVRNLVTQAGVMHAFYISAHVRALPPPDLAKSGFARRRPGRPGGGSRVPATLGGRRHGGQRLLELDRFGAPRR